MARHATPSWCQICHRLNTGSLTGGRSPIPIEIRSFDDSVFSVDELEKAVVVKIADRPVALFTFPECRCLDGAARESRIESLHAEREVLSERFATLSFDVQKLSVSGVQPLYRQSSGGCV